MGKEKFWIDLKSFMESLEKVPEDRLREEALALIVKPSSSPTKVKQRINLPPIRLSLIILTLLEGLIIGAIVGGGISYLSLSFLIPLIGGAYIILRTLKNFKIETLLGLSVGLYLGVVSAAIVYLSYLYEGFMDFERMKNMLLSNNELIMFFAILAVIALIIKIGNDKIPKSDSRSFIVGMLLLAVVGGKIVAQLDIVAGNLGMLIILAIIACVLAMFNKSPLFKLLSLILLLLSSTVFAILEQQNLAFVFEFHGPFAAINIGLEPFLIFVIIILAPLLYSWAYKKA